MGNIIFNMVRGQRTQRPALRGGLGTGTGDSATSTQAGFGDWDGGLSAQHPPCTEDSALSSHALQTPGFSKKSPRLGRCPTPHRHRQTHGERESNPQAPALACLPWPKASLRP